MKKFKLIFGLMLIIGFLPVSNVYGDGYILLTGGAGGKADAGSVGLEGGWIGQNFLLGIGLSAVSTDTEDLPAPAGYYKYEDELEGYGAVGIKIITNWFLVATAGYSEQEKKYVLQYPGGEVEFDEGKKGYFTYSGQLQYVYKRFIIGGYHNRRGVVGRVGFTF